MKIITIKSYAIVGQNLQELDSKKVILIPNLRDKRMKKVFKEIDKEEANFSN